MSTQTEPRPAATRQSLDLAEFGDELKATLAARREISPDMEDQLVKNFLVQVERRIDAHIDQRLGDRSRSRAVGQTQQTAMVKSILGIAIPLVVLAGIFGGTQAIVAVCGLILIVSLASLFRS